MDHLEHEARNRDERRIARRRRARSRHRNQLILAATGVVLLLAFVALLLLSRTPAPSPGEVLPVPGDATTTAEATPPTTPPAPPPAPEPPPPPTPFDLDAAMDDITALSAIGVRSAGSSNEVRGADYVAGVLEDAGYDVAVETFSLPTGASSLNVIARAQGATTDRLVLGAHIDTKAPSPGANDNASGCGVLLEIARRLAAQPVTVTVEFAFFGSEEIVDRNPNHHHLGSQHRVDSMSPSERQGVAGMISVDMVGFGPDFHVRTMGRGPSTLSDALLAEARAQALPMTYLRDTGQTGWSDHGPYELANIPSAWIEWRPDDAYHTTADDASHVDSGRVETTGVFLLKYIRGIEQDDLAALRQ